MIDEPRGRFLRFFRELKRRNVYRVAVTYAVVAFVAIQAADLLVPQTTLPAWSDQLLIYLAVFGFPIALVIAWAFEMTPEGVRRTPETEVTGEPSTGGAGGWIVALVVVLVAGGGFWYLTTGGGEEAAKETAAAGDTAGTVATDTAGPPRIAVLPFENIARDTGDAFFARGMHEEVLNQLSKVSGLGVLSRTTMMEYEDAGLTATEIGRKLDVKAILEGTVRRAGDQVRITTQLIDARRGTHLWSNTYDHRLSVEAIFDIQAAIAEQIAGALETQLIGAERQRIKSAPTEHLAAYDAFLKGRNQWWRWAETFERSHADRAVKHFRDAIGRDSTFATAHAWLATAQGSRYQVSRQRRWLDSARAALDRARSIDPNPAQLYVAEGYVQFLADSMESAEVAVRRALELEPSNVLAQVGLATALGQQGEVAKAIRWTSRAVQLDPRRPFVLNQHSFWLRGAGLLGPAEAWYRRALDIDPRYESGGGGLILVQLYRGNHREALRTVRSFLRRSPDRPDVLEVAGRAAVFSGQPERSKRYLNRLQEVRTADSAEGSPSAALEVEERLQLGWAEIQLGNVERGRSLVREAADSLRRQLERNPHPGRRMWLAGALAVLGRQEAALRRLQTAVKRGYADLYALKANPLFSSLRSTSQFREIIGRLEAEKEKIQKNVRRMDIDLYPPGAEPDTATPNTKTDT